MKSNPASKRVYLDSIQNQAPFWWLNLLMISALSGLFAFGFMFSSHAQEPVQESETSMQESVDQNKADLLDLIPRKRRMQLDQGVWFGLYTTYKLSKDWAYYGEYHLRRSQVENSWDTIGRMSKLYIRLGAMYKAHPQLNITMGVVNRYTWSETYPDPLEEKWVPEFRFWEQLLFKQRMFGIKLYHQVRVEQRWRRSTRIADPTFYYYNRFRYKLLGYFPIFGKLTRPGSFYGCLYNEIFMQQGKKVQYNFFEDNRAYMGVAYAFSDAFHLHFGYMKSFGQLNALTFRNHDIFRLSLYNKFDFYK